MNLLFICTHNRCRSVICEAITNHLGSNRIKAFSAGSQPAGEIHPLTLKYLAKRGFATAGLKSESWDAYAGKDIDVAITVCDIAASESCPLWMGDTLKVHWGLADPTKLQGTDAEVELAFNDLIDLVASRIRRLLRIDLSNLTPTQLADALNQVAEDN